MAEARVKTNEALCHARNVVMNSKGNEEAYNKGLEDAWVNNANGLGITYHEHFFLFRIDYILHSPSIKTYQTQVDKVSHSDHYPLWTYFQL